MKNKKVIFSAFLAFFIGWIFEIIYWTVGDVGIAYLYDFWGDYTYFYQIIFFSYITVIALIGLVLIIRCYKKEGRVINLFNLSFIVVAAFILHSFFVEHDSIVYYRLHGTFYPLANDLGYSFFELFLGSVYLIWISAIIIVLVRKKIKTNHSDEIRNE